VKALEAAGFIILRQHGSHVILRRQEPLTHDGRYPAVARNTFANDVVLIKDLNVK